MKRLEVLRTINLSSLRNEKSIDNLIGEAKRQGAIDELEKLEERINGHSRDNTVWYEGNQYFENVLTYLEKRLVELRKGCSK